MLAGGVRCFQSLPQGGQCRRPIAVPGQTLGQERQTIRQKESAPEPGPVRYALADAGGGFVDGALSEQSRAAQCARFEDQREPLLRGQRLGGFELAQGSFGLAAIEMNQRGIGEGKAQRERVGEPLRQSQRTGDAGERLLGISEQPFGLSADILGADTGIMPAINKTMGRVLLRIVEQAPDVGVPACFCRIAGKHPRRPAGTMRLEPQFIISRPFGHPQQALGERAGGG
jgi:hypothetical protein